MVSPTRNTSKETSPKPAECSEIEQANVISSWCNMISWIADSVSSISFECKPIILPLLPTSWSDLYLTSSSSSSSSSSSTTVTGTILSNKIMRKKNKHGGSGIKLCIQESGPAFLPIVVLDLPIASHELNGQCRIVLECESAQSGGGHLMGTSMWAVHFNGKKVGYGWRREVEDDHVGCALHSIRNVSVGMGLLPPPLPVKKAASESRSSDIIGDNIGGGGYEYLRGKFQRVVGSVDSQSFHLVDPAGCLGGHDLSFFFVRL